MNKFLYLLYCLKGFAKLYQVNIYRYLVIPDIPTALLVYLPKSLSCHDKQNPDVGLPDSDGLAGGLDTDGLLSTLLPTTILQFCASP